MSSTAVVELDSVLEEIMALDAWAPSDTENVFDELHVESREVIAITSDFATMGGSRLRRMD